MMGKISIKRTCRHFGETFNHICLCKQLNTPFINCELFLVCILWYMHEILFLTFILTAFSQIKCKMEIRIQNVKAPRIGRQPRGCITFNVWRNIFCNLFCEIIFYTSVKGTQKVWCLVSFSGTEIQGRRFGTNYWWKCATAGLSRARHWCTTLQFDNSSFRPFSPAGECGWCIKICVALSGAIKILTLLGEWGEGGKLFYCHI